MLNSKFLFLASLQTVFGGDFTKQVEKIAFGLSIFCIHFIFSDIANHGATLLTKPSKIEENSNIVQIKEIFICFKNTFSAPIKNFNVFRSFSETRRDTFLTKPSKIEENSNIVQIKEIFICFKNTFSAIV